MEWIRHLVDYGGRAGDGLHLVAEDIDGDGDRDVVTAGKTGLFLSENLSAPGKNSAAPQSAVAIPPPHRGVAAGAILRMMRRYEVSAGVPLSSTARITCATPATFGTTPVLDRPGV